MNKLSSFLILIIILMVGCSKPVVIRQEHKFVNENWQKFDTLNFSVEGLTDGIPRDLNMVIRFNANFTSRELPVNILILSPDGSESYIEKKIWVRNTDDTPRGERFGETNWDYTFCFRESFEFTSEGKYKILIDNNTRKFDNVGIEQIAFEAVPATDKTKNKTEEAN